MLLLVIVLSILLLMSMVMLVATIARLNSLDKRWTVLCDEAYERGMKAGLTIPGDVYDAYHRIFSE